MAHLVPSRKLTQREPHVKLSFGSLLGRNRQKGHDVTVCIAARAGPNLMGASDRMLTSGAIQFEPAISAKPMSLTNSIAIMQAGDAAFHAEIFSEVSPIVLDRIQKEPNNWWRVKDVAELYVSCRNEIKRRRAESALLSPLGLTGDSFRRLQRELNDGVAEQLIRDIINYQVPRVSVLVVGIDPLGPHIYVMDDDEIRCNDLIGFAAIGIGARHAESQFMLGRHSWNSSAVDTGLLTYIAKKRSEIAPGVGEGTDMFTIGPGLGSLTIITPELMDGLDQVYQKLISEERRIQDDARKEANNYVNRAAEAARRAADQAKGQQEAPAADPESVPAKEARRSVAARRKRAEKVD
jgi:hypothetical protein